MTAAHWHLVTNASDPEIAFASTPPSFLAARVHTDEILGEARDRRRELYYEHAAQWRRWRDRNARVGAWALQLRAVTGQADADRDPSWEIEMAWREFPDLIGDFDASLPTDVQEDLAEYHAIIDAYDDAWAQWRSEQAPSPGNAPLDPGYGLATWPTSRALVQSDGPATWGAVLSGDGLQLVSDAFASALRDAGLDEGWSTLEVPVYDTAFQRRASHRLLLVTATTAVRSLGARPRELAVVGTDNTSALARPAYVDELDHAGHPTVLSSLLASPAAARALEAAELADLELVALHNAAPDDRG